MCLFVGLHCGCVPPFENMCVRSLGYIVGASPPFMKICVSIRWITLWVRPPLMCVLACCLHRFAAFFLDTLYLRKNAAKRSRQHERIKQRLSSNEMTHTRGGHTHNVTQQTYTLKWGEAPIVTKRTNTQGVTNPQCKPMNGHPPLVLGSFCPLSYRSGWPELTIYCLLSRIKAVSGLVQL